MGRFGPWEILIIVLLIVILFGHNKIPGMMRNLAGGIKVFKKELKDTKSENAAAKKDVAKKETVKRTPAKRAIAKKAASKKAVKKN